MKRLQLIIVILLVSFPLFSQLPPPGPGNPGCWPPPCIPIDGGISIFTIIAAYFGYKCYNKSNH